MQAVVFEKPYEMVVRDVPKPQIKSSEVLVQVEAGGICGTDVNLYVGGFDPRYPLIPGHEFAGVISEVGSEVTAYSVGQRVAVDCSVYCEKCYFCRQNMQNHCESWNALGVTLAGGFAEFVAVPERCIFPIPDTLSFAEAAFVEPLACVLYGLERARIRMGDSVLIFGAGPIGLLHQQLAKQAGASSATVVDLRDDRLAIARDLGADHTINGARLDELKPALMSIEPRGFDIVIEATGVPQVVENAVKYVKNAGKLLVFGVSPNDSEIRINPYEIYRRDLEIIGAFALRKTFQQALEVLQHGVVQVKPLIGATMNLADFPKALQMMKDGTAPMKIQIDPQNRVK